MSAMLIRRFQSGDGIALRRVFDSAIHCIASANYSTEQIDAWAPARVDAALWEQHMQALNPFVAVLAGDVVGYADVQNSGYIDHFYVSGDHPRRGIGMLLMEQIHAEASLLRLTELTSKVSVTAEPFFARFGFEVMERTASEIRGVLLPNAFMRKALLAPH